MTRGITSTWGDASSTNRGGLANDLARTGGTDMDPRGHPSSRARLNRRVALGGAVAAAATEGLSRVSQVAAQEVPPNIPTEDPIVGAWQWNAAPARPEPATFAIFHADGTYTEWQPVAGTAIGIWRMTGDRTYDLLFVFPDTDPSLAGFGPGTSTFMISIELDDMGNALTAQGMVDVRDAGGVQLATVPWSRPATRMTFETNPATGSIPATPTS